MCFSNNEVSRKKEVYMNQDMYTKGALGKFVGRLPPGRYDSHVHVRAEEPILWQ